EERIAGGALGSPLSPPTYAYDVRPRRAQQRYWARRRVTRGAVRKCIRSGAGGLGGSRTRVATGRQQMDAQRIGAMRTGAGRQPLPFSPAVQAGDFVFVSGQVAMGPNGEVVPGGIESQTRLTLENVRAILEQAGCTLADVVKVTVWLDAAGLLV